MTTNDREQALSLMATLLAAGFSVKLYAYRTHLGRVPSNDKALWDGPVAYEVYVPDTSNLRTLLRIQTIIEPLGMDAWLSTDEDGHVGLKMEKRRT